MKNPNRKFNGQKSDSLDKIQHYGNTVCTTPPPPSYRLPACFIQLHYLQATDSLHVLHNSTTSKLPTPCMFYTTPLSPSYRLPACFTQLHYPQATGSLHVLHNSTIPKLPAPCMFYTTPLPPSYWLPACFTQLHYLQATDTLHVLYNSTIPKLPAPCMFYTTPLPPSYWLPACFIQLHYPQATGSLHVLYNSTTTKLLTPCMFYTTPLPPSYRLPACFIQLNYHQATDSLHVLYNSTIPKLPTSCMFYTTPLPPSYWLPACFIQLHYHQATDSLHVLYNSTTPKLTKVKNRLCHMLVFHFCLFSNFGGPLLTYCRLLPNRHIPFHPGKNKLEAKQGLLHDATIYGDDFVHLLKMKCKSRPMLAWLLVLHQSVGLTSSSILVLGVLWLLLAYSKCPKEKHFKLNINALYVGLRSVHKLVCLFMWVIWWGKYCQKWCPLLEANLMASATNPLCYEWT